MNSGRQKTVSYTGEAGGIKAAFLCGAILSLAAMVTVFFIRKPEVAASGGAAGH